jgi:acyl carrier protein
LTLTSDTILEFLGDELGVETGDIAPDTPLFSTGIIDSFGLVTLMTYIEGQCKIRIKPADVNLDNFDSLQRIVAFVHRSAA